MHLERKLKVIFFMNKKPKIYFPIRTEDQLISCLNIVRRELGCKGFFELKQIKKLLSKENYRTFTIPKKTGEKRLISVPNTELAFLQYCVAKLMAKKFRPHPNANGFIAGKSILSNAYPHIGKEVIFNTDIKDFFDSISLDIIVEKLIRQPYYFSFKVALFIAFIVTKLTNKGSRVLPQGSPSSPIFTNIVLNQLDHRLSKFAKYHGLVYSRYADDLTFSFDSSLFYMWDDGEGGYKYNILKFIKSEGLDINHKKTHIAFKKQRHKVTGLIVNEKINVERKYIKNLRTEIHNWEKDGYIIASYKFLKNREGKIPYKTNIPMHKVLFGKLSFVKMVKGEQDSTYLKLKQRFNLLIQRDYSFIRTERESIEINNIFNARRYKHKDSYEYDTTNPHNNKKYQWDIIKKRNFTNQEIALIEKGVIVSSNYGNSVRFTLTDGRIKYIPLSNSSPKGIGENIDKNQDKVIILKRRKKIIFRIE